MMKIEIIDGAVFQDGIKLVPEVDPLAEVKAAFQAGKQVQCFHSGFAQWLLHSNPSFDTRFEWRIKPPDRIEYITSNNNCAWWRHFDQQTIQGGLSQIRLTFDGDTGKLKAAEVLS